MKQIRLIALVLLLASMSFAQQGSQKAQQEKTSGPKNQQKQAQESGEYAPALPQGRVLLGGTPSEQRIAREVRHDIIMDPYYSVFDWIGYKVEGNKVILVGDVINPTVKSDAEASVKKIEGVQQVENKINVLPPSPMDSRLRAVLYRAIYGYDGLYRYAWEAVQGIHIIVNNGHVKLFGIVNSEADKNMAGIQAKSVPGTFSVQNNLLVVKNESKKDQGAGKK